MSKRPDVPAPVEREVRQRCGFGCVICGLPIYDYEHMYEWAVVKRHVADEMTLLCNAHHRERTSGLLPVELVIHADKNPYNLQKGVSKPYDLRYYGSSATVKFGNVAFVSPKPAYGLSGIIPLMIDNVPIIRVGLMDGHYLLNVAIFDEQNDLVLRIRNNALVYKIGIWDVTFIQRTLTIRRAKGNIFLEIEFIPPNEVFIKRGRFHLNGIEISVSPGKLLFNNSNVSFANLTIESRVGITIGSNPLIRSLFTLPDHKRLDVPFIVYPEHWEKSEF